MPLMTFPRTLGALTALTALAAALAGCGGGGSNPLDNPSAIQNPPVVGGQKLSFAYFQRCVNPIFVTPLQVTLNGTTSTNTCGGGGCHDTVTGTGGAFRVVPGAQPLDLTDPANTPEVLRASDMYKNFYSAQGEVVMGSLTQSRLLAKPRLMNVLHGGGLIFTSDADPNVKRITYWITHPMPQGQDEFSTAGYNLFTPADPNTGACNE
jgi:predicted small lipoprotein YifL